MTVLVIDCANVVGARPDGWWRDRAAAAVRLYEAVAAADLDDDEIVLVFEGAAKGGVPAVRSPGLRVVHAPKDGDSTIVAEARRARERGHLVRVVTADRALAANVAAHATTVSPRWLWERISR